MNTNKNQIKRVKLGARVRIVGGGTPSRKVERYFKGSIPWVTVKDLKSSYIYDSQEHISEEAIQDSATNLIPAGTVITCTRMALGKALINKVPIAINQDLKALLCDENTHPEYLRYFIASKADWIISQGSGATVKGVKLDALRELDFPDISLPEQKRIAEILDLADEARRKRRENLTLTDDLIRSLFLQTFGDPATNPMGWDVKDIGDIAEVSTGKTPSRACPEYYEGDVPWVKTTEVDGALILETSECISKAAVVKCSMKVFPVNSILIAMYGQGKTRGQSARLGIPATTNQACGVILPSDGYCTGYLETYLAINYDAIRSLGRGGNQQNLNLSLVRGIKVLFPPVNFQEKFADQVNEIHEQKAREQALYEQHDDLFNSLLQRAFKGELGEKDEI